MWRRLSNLVLALGLSASAFGCGSSDPDPDAQKLSELSDPEFVAACQSQRDGAGAAALTGFQHFSCYGASIVGGTCNATIFENCVATASPACAAPAAQSPLRSCAATVGQARTCMVAFLAQFSAYQTASCAAPPTPTPTALSGTAACAEFCSLCPSAC
jgi:hypothetical protein